jgi:hypothetical protein
MFQEIKGCPGERRNASSPTASAVRFPVVSHVGMVSQKDPNTYRQLRTLLV